MIKSFCVEYTTTPFPQAQKNNRGWCKDAMTVVSQRVRLFSFNNSIWREWIILKNEFIISDNEFREKINKIKQFIFTKEISKINIFFENKILINLTYDNFSHLIGLQYYLKILSIKKHKNVLFGFLNNISNQKILWSSICKKIKNEWKRVNFNSSFANWYDCIAKLIFKINGFIKLMEIISQRVTKSPQYLTYKFQNKNQVDYFLMLDLVKKNFYCFLGLKNISGDNYQYRTFKAITIKSLKKIVKNYENQNWILERVNIFWAKK